MSRKVAVFHSTKHRSHEPLCEAVEGTTEVLPCFECPARIDRCIVPALSRQPWADLCDVASEQFSRFGPEAVLAVHSERYLEHLRTAFHDWEEAYRQRRGGGAGDAAANIAAVPPLVPSAFTSARSRISHDDSAVPRSVIGRAGFFAMDVDCPILSGTFDAVMDSVQCALLAAQAVQLKNGSRGHRTAFAVCRPPGHHAGREFAAGYCYLNNAAIAAHYLLRSGEGCARVAILDVDYHAGNGTEEIFYDRADVVTVSIHADPAVEYPYFGGRESECGSAAGKGFHRNYPLPLGTDDAAYLRTLERAIAFVREVQPTYLVISAGFDTADGDPLGGFRISTDGFGRIGAAIASALDLPTVIVLEGGYRLETLGENVVRFLQPFVRP